MNRIDATFAELKARGRKALIGFLTAGDPDRGASLAILRRACASGLDVLELGVPFSDPTCDGPVIQRASQRALAAGMSLGGAIGLAAELRKSVQTPIVLFSYYNPIFKYGLERAAREAAAAGVDGFLVVDLPPEEAGPFAAALEGTGIRIIRIAAPTTTPARLKLLLDGAGGFLYLITRLGVTGVGGLKYDGIEALAARVKSHCSLPVCLGFGISAAEDARTLAPCADGLVVGSALVRIVEAGDGSPETADRIAAKIAELRRGIDAAGR